MHTAEAIIDWAQRRGSDTTDLRDAAHEASHALEVRPRKWDRESIHAKIVRKGKAFMVRTELEARAVERIVCAAHAVTHDWASFEFICFMEASRSGIWLPKNLGELIVKAMETPAVIARATIILRCGEEP